MPSWSDSAGAPWARAIAGGPFVGVEGAAPRWQDGYFQRAVAAQKEKPSAHLILKEFPPMVTEQCDEPSALGREAHALIRARDYAAAGPVLERALALDPGSAM